MKLEKKRKMEESFQKKLEEFCLFDDDFMSKVFDENIECTELLLRIILEQPEIRVEEVHTQKEIKNLKGHSVRLDIDARGVNGEPVNVEVQRADRGAEVKRARYNSSMIDANTFPKSEDYRDLPESYVIFITEKDVLGQGIPVYHADRIILETGNYLGDGAHIVYVNGAYRGDTPVGRLMHDFSCKNPEEMYYEELAEQVALYKGKSKGERSMSQLMEKVVKEFMEEFGRDYVRVYHKEEIEAELRELKENYIKMAEERNQKMVQDMAQNMAQDMAQDMAQNMVEKKNQELVYNLLKTKKLSLEEISACARLPLEKVEAIAEEAGFLVASM